MMKAEKHRKLKGTVLFTVVSVLAILIIFMTCALAMAAAANKRSRKTYSASQSNYTARTAIDSILAAIGTSKDMSQAVRNLGANAELELAVNISDVSLGSVSNAKIKNIGQKPVFDPETNAWVNRNVFSITCDVTIGGETTRITTNVVQDKPTDKKKGGGGGGPGFLTYGAGELGTFTSIWGGAYIGMGEWTDDTGKTKRWDSADLQYLLKYDKDSINPATGLFGDLITPADHLYWSNKTYKLQNDSVCEAPIVYNGNLKLVNDLEIYFTELRKGASIWGNMVIENNGLIFSASPNLKSIIHEDKVSDPFDLPYLFVDGKLTTNNMVETNKKDVPVNIYCGSLDSYIRDNNGNIEMNGGTPKTANKYEIAGDIYCMDPKETSEFNSQGTRLYSWVDAVVKKGDVENQIGGSVYSNGNVKISCQNGMKIDGDLRVAGDLTIDNTAVEVGGIVAVGGTLTIKGDKELKVSDTDKFVNHTTIENKNKNNFSGIYADFVSGSKFKAGASTLKPGYTATEKDAILVANLGFQKDAYNKSNIPWVWCSDEILNYTSGKATKKTLNHDNKTREYWDFNWNKPNDDVGTPDYVIEGTFDINEAVGKQVKATTYMKDGVVVSAASAAIMSDLKYDNKDIYPTSVYKGAVKGNAIYPEKAKRESLLGLQWPVEGMSKGQYIKSIPNDVKVDKIVKPNTLAGNITESCTITGAFTNTINVVTNGSDIYIKLKDFSLINESDPTLAKINVDDKKGGKVYFALEGSITNNFKSDDLANNKVIKTVYEQMEEFKIESVKETPPAGLKTFNYVIPKDSNNQDVKVERIKITAEGDYANGVVFDSTSLPGANAFSGGTDRIIEITPTNNADYWVVLDGVTIGNNISFLINDDDPSASTVKFYIKGKCSLTSSGTFIATKSYYDLVKSNKNILIYSNPNLADSTFKAPISGTVLPTPIIEYYSEPTGASLSLDGGNYLVGYVKGKDLTVDSHAIYENASLMERIYYDGVKLSTTDIDVNRIAVIGCLNAGTVKAGDQPFEVLYVSRDPQPDPDPNKQVTDAENKHTYETVEYMAYSYTV